MIFFIYLVYKINQFINRQFRSEESVRGHKPTLAPSPGKRDFGRTAQLVVGCLLLVIILKFKLILI